MKEGLTGAEGINPYDEERGKGEQVEQMFDAIAPAYDFMNTAMTFGLHNRWRAKALDAAAATPGLAGNFGKYAALRMLDIATGTGDVAFDLHSRFKGARITGVDLSEGMLAVARDKLAHDDDETARETIDFMQGDCLNLPFADDTFHLITVAYGVRNFAHLESGLREMHRVLRRGGTLCVIELSEPSNALMHAGYRLYTRAIIPLAGRLVSGDKRAYSYLLESIAAAPQRDAMAAIMKTAGFSQVQWKSLTAGAVSYYLASKQ